MVQITVFDPAGNAHELDAPEGDSLMHVVRMNSIDGIVAECNGNAACATCHIYLDDESAGKLPPPEEHEAEMLEFTAAESRPTSRLSCQVKICPSLQGMRAWIPATQV
jgi:2Fe-2S ferredoxin